MSGPLPRRRLLSGGAALAATAVIAAPSLKDALASSRAAGLASNVVVRWNAKLGRWAARPADADFGVVFLSTNDAAASAPTDTNVQTGDVWRRHPDAEEHA